MKRKFIKSVAALGAAATLAVGFGGCNLPGNNGGGDGNTDKVDSFTTYTASTIGFTDNSGTSQSYNTGLYYRNDLTLDMGDPMLLYDNETFYAYGTRAGTNIEVFTSMNLSDWSSASVAFNPAANSWSRTSIWAPDIHKIGDKWYLYYTASYTEPGASKDNCQIGVAVADDPAGPYVQYVGPDADNNQITVDKPPFYWKNHTILDQHVFVDDDGEMYMFFSYDTNYAQPDDLGYYAGLNNGTAEIWGVKMKDPVTWDFSTLTPLISAGYKKYSDKIAEKEANKSNGKNRTIEWETWSPSFSEPMECVEGPYMIKRDGKYFLTYCANSFVDMEYSVGYAVADDPLGAYEKPNDTYLQNMLVGVPAARGHYTSNRYKGFMTGTGHASICKVGDEYMFGYHAHYNRDEWGALQDIYGYKSEWRALGVDYLLFDEQGMPYTNGPTYSLQKLPDAVTGYKNLALGAQIKGEGKNINYLNDNYTNRAIRTEEVAKEAQFTAGKRNIEIKFDSPVYVKAVNIFNSYDYEKSTTFIEQIDFGDNKGIVNLVFNNKYIDREQEFIFPHSAYNIELDAEVRTDRIVITIDCSHDFALGEIEVIGRK